MSEWEKYLSQEQLHLAYRRQVAQEQAAAEEAQRQARAAAALKSLETSPGFSEARGNQPNTTGEKFTATTYNLGGKKRKTRSRKTKRRGSRKHKKTMRRRRR